VKSDDSSLSPQDLYVIEQRAALLLNKADAWNIYPIPIDDLLAAANVRVASHSIFDSINIISYLKGKTQEIATNVKSAVAKVLGLYDAHESLIHIDETVGKSKQIFLKLHETGHHDIPTHKKIFRFFQECEKTLSPEIADQFEREANNFARFVLFKGDSFKSHAADHAFEIKTPIKLAKKFGASIYASAREYARTNPRSCAVYVLEPVEYLPGHGARASVRRIEPSAKFLEQFGCPSEAVITPDHPLGPVLPIGRKMTPQTLVLLKDRNGDSHECLAEAFDTTHNIIILIYPVKALNKFSIIIPEDF